MLHIILNVPKWLQFISKRGVECSAKTVFYMVTIYKINKTHHEQKRSRLRGRSREKSWGRIRD